MLAQQVSGYVQAYTLYSSVRPFGCSVMIASSLPNDSSLYSISPSGEVSGYKANALGKGKQVAKTQLEKLDFNLSLQEAVKEAARMYMKRQICLFNSFNHPSYHAQSNYHLFL